MIYFDLCFRKIILVLIWSIGEGDKLMEGLIEVVQWEWENVKDLINFCEGIKFMDRLDIKFERMAISKNNVYIFDLGNLEEDDVNYQSWDIFEREVVGRGDDEYILGDYIIKM